MFGFLHLVQCTSYVDETALLESEAITDLINMFSKFLLNKRTKLSGGSAILLFAQMPAAVLGGVDDVN